MNDLERLLIERACARIVTQYCHHVDHGEAAKIADLFADDGAWVTAESTTSGREAITKTFAGRERNKRRMSRHVCNNLLVEVTSETTARGVVYLTLYRHDAEEGRATSPVGPPAMIGEYRDEYVKTADGWRFKRRELVVNFL